MGLFDGLRGRMRRSTELSALLDGFGLRQDPGYTPNNYTSMAMEGYGFNDTVRACVDITNTAVMGLQLTLMKAGNGKAEREQNTNHPLLKLLQKPNPRMSRSEFLEYISGSLLLDGNAFIVPVNPLTRKGAPVGLFPLRPDLVRVEEYMLGEVPTLRYEYRPPLGNAARYAANEIIHIKLFNPTDGLRGLSPMSAARAPMDRSNASEKWNYSLMNNSAKPSGILTTDQDIHENQREQIEKQRDRMTGLLNVGKAPIMSKNLTWQQISLSPVDMDWLKGDDAASLKIARAFRVPAQKLGIPGAQTYANMEQADRAFYQDNILPLAGRIVDRLNMQLTPLYGDGLSLAVDRDAIPALRDNQDAVYQRMNTSEFLTINEKRQATGYDTIGTKGDVILVSAGKIPLELAMQDDTAAADEGDSDEGGNPLGGAY